MRKNIKEDLELLGAKYCEKVIDLERCVYRDFGNGYDIEISGLDNKKRNPKVTIYLWCKKERVEIVKSVSDVDMKDVHSEVEKLYEWTKERGE